MAIADLDREVSDAVLPGYYRATKRWDIAVVVDGELFAVMELKSIVSSFGNNLNNRIEEAVGNNTDLYQAYQEGLFVPSPTTATRSRSGWSDTPITSAANPLDRSVCQCPVKTS